MKFHQGCVHCKNNLSFTMPKEIVDAAVDEKLVIFAGAGISTEGRGVLPYSFYDEVCKDLRIKSNPDKYPFPKIVNKYCEKFGRNQMIEKIMKRFQMIQSFPELYYEATKFHKELSTISQIKLIFTTNWDTFFEDECGAIAFVSSKDFAFWNVPGRKVFKIHGSISNIGSIIATEEDYNKSYRQLKNELIGNYLKIALSTQKFLFCGFSMNDKDFQKILQLLKKELKDYSPRFYLVTLDQQIDKQKLREYNIQPIFTDATFFIHKLKLRLIRQKALFDDKIFIDVCKKSHEIEYIHDKINEDNLPLTYPISIYTLAYQDGIMHAFDRMLVRSKTGEYSNCCRVSAVIHTYENIIKQMVKSKNYMGVAYTRGYLNGLYFLVLGKKGQKMMPLYYLYNEEICANYNGYKKILHDNRIFHKQSHDVAKQIIEKMKIGLEGIVFHHRPIL